MTRNRLPRNDHALRSAMGDDDGNKLGAAGGVVGCGQTLSWRVVFFQSAPMLTSAIAALRHRPPFHFDGVRVIRTPSTAHDNDSQDQDRLYAGSK
jgi:hypothetical protein